MGFECKRIAKAYAGVPGPGNFNWEVANDYMLFNMASQLHGAGWNVEYRHHYLKVVTTHDINHFSGHSDDFFSAVFPNPVALAGGAKAQLVIDVVPPLYTPVDPFEIGIVTGTTAKADCHIAIVNIITAMDWGLHGEIFKIGTDPSDPDPNTILMFVQAGTEGSFPGAVLHRQWDPEVDPPRELIPPAPAVGLNTNLQFLRGGGYAATTEDGGTSLFLFRNGTGGIEACHTSILFAKTIPSQNDIVHGTPGVGFTNAVEIEFVRSAFIFATNPTGAYLQQVSDGKTGHFTSASLDLPLAGDNLVTEAAVGIAGSGGGGTLRFRDGPTENTLSGTLLVSLNGANVINPSGQSHFPRFMTLLAQSNAGHPWENGLAQITEAWSAFQPTFSLASAPVLGRLPGMLVVNRGMVAEGSGLLVDDFDTDGMAFFDFDGVRYKVITSGATLSFGVRGLGTVCARHDS